ncbi:Dihydroorotate dehydrogenase B (NAD(+)), electron transfer subunit [uncultured archaeon]|nr:Dihydroorotate dehydrogenase B (NAD(+)), electron transfer subunit [uncultured archaeon]
MNYTKAKIFKTEFLNDSIYSLYVEKPVNTIFVPGQFYMIKSDSFPDKFARSYSIASINQENFLRFAIKITGSFTKALSELPKDFELDLFGPMGKFSVKPEANTVLLVAGGIGIAPFLSMLKQNFVDKKKHFTLLYSCKTKDEAAYADELNSLNFQNESASNSTLFFYSRENSRITEETLSSYLDFDEFMTCGPDSLMNYCKAFWNSKEIFKDKIRFESFGLPSKK